MIEDGMSVTAFKGDQFSGDLGIIQFFGNGVLVAAIDGLGHGEEAAFASQTAAIILKENAQDSPVDLLQKCHLGLRRTRGAAISLASFNTLKNTMSWAGVGNVEGVLFCSGRATKRETLLLRNGIVGFNLPNLRVITLPVEKGDTLIFASDGIQPTFSFELDLKKTSQELAEFVMKQYLKGTDDALVVVARYIGSQERPSERI